MEDGHLKNFFLPKMTPEYLVRVAIVAVLAYVIFGHLCIPARLSGSSMEPIYHDGGINFCWTPAYWYKSPERGDVLMVRLAGKKIMFLKRIVAVVVAVVHGGDDARPGDLERNQIIRARHWNTVRVHNGRTDNRHVVPRSFQLLVLSF